MRRAFVRVLTVVLAGLAGCATWRGARSCPPGVLGPIHVAPLELRAPAVVILAVDACTGHPVPGALVQSNTLQLRSVTDSNGVSVIQPRAWLPSIDLIVRRFGYSPARDTVAPPGQGAVLVYVRLYPRGPLEPAGRDP